MEVVSRFNEQGQLVLRLGRDELQIASTAFNEVCNGPGRLDYERDFLACIGLDRDVARALLRRVAAACPDQGNQGHERLAPREGG